MWCCSRTRVIPCSPASHPSAVGVKPRSIWHAAHERRPQTVNIRRWLSKPTCRHVCYPIMCSVAQPNSTRLIYCLFVRRDALVITVRHEHVCPSSSLVFANLPSDLIRYLLQVKTGADIQVAMSQLTWFHRSQFLHWINQFYQVCISLSL